MNTRIAMFKSFIVGGTFHRIQFAQRPPNDMLLALGQNNLYQNPQMIFVEVPYTTQNSIRVTVNGQVFKPSIGLINTYNIDNGGACGYHEYFINNMTLTVQLQGKYINDTGVTQECEVRLTVTNSIQLKTWLSMSIDEFWAKDGDTLFIDRLAALLDITDKSRIKIVGVYNGSVQIVAFIE